MSDLLQFSPSEGSKTMHEGKDGPSEGLELEFRPRQTPEKAPFDDDWGHDLIIEAISSSARCMNALLSNFDWDEDEEETLDLILQAIVDFGTAFVERWD